MLKQDTYKIVYICFSVTVFCYRLQNKFKGYNVYKEIHLCDLFFIHIYYIFY